MLKETCNKVCETYSAFKRSVSKCSRPARKCLVHMFGGKLKDEIIIPQPQKIYPFTTYVPRRIAKEAILRYYQTEGKCKEEISYMEKDLKRLMMNKICETLMDSDFIQFKTRQDDEGTVYRAELWVYKGINES